jgi:two-component system, cell cycle sensor histidine kinase and response regulator CckA
MPDTPQGARQQALRYLLPVIVTVAAVVLTHLVRPLVGPAVFPFFILAVAIASVYGGTGPGALAAVLSVGALSVWFLPPFHADTPADWARQATFLVVATVIVLVCGSVYQRREKAVDQARENERLRHLAEEAAAEAEMATQQATEATQQAEEEASRARDAALEAELAAQEVAEALARQQEAEAALRRSQGELADFFETASTGLHWVAEDGTIVLVNQAELDMLGYAREEYVGRHIAEFHVDQPVIEDILQRLLAGERIREYPARLRCKDGQLKHVVIDSSGYFHEGRFSHTRCFTRDVTVERQAREAIARLAAIVTSSSDAIVGKTLEGTITSWNAAAERIFGYTAAEMIGESIFKLIPPDHHGSERELLERLRQGETVELSEAERIRKDGRRIWISLSVSPVKDATGAIAGAASIKRDITERKLLDERLSNIQRLQAVGQLAGGIAHEANNQMSVVLGGAHFLLRRSDLPEQARSDIAQMRQAAERTASITQQLLAFSRRQMLRLEDVNLNDVVQSIGPVLRRSLTENQNLGVRLGLLGGTVRADPRQLEQVLLNLTLNARDAMPEGGQLTIETMEVELNATDAAQQDIPTGRYEALIVRDTGHGMDPPTLRRAFEPFFTTKEVGKGSGLGLSVAHGIVHQIGGHIRVESAANHGTTFRLFFPKAAPMRVEERPVPGELHPAEPGSVTLVVEDDARVRTMAARALAEAGYGILEADSGRAALELVRKHRGRLDLVVTDVGMSEMNGFELARRLREERPGLRVLFMTGYGDGHHREYSAEAEGGRVLQKPFSPDDLVRTATEVLTTGKTVS